MEWWSVFFRARKAVFFFISITSLLWAVVLAVYLARLWSHLLWAQRSIVLAIIGANVFTAIMIYLMAVVVFRFWLDLARVIFLLLLHVASALMFTLFGSNFSCDTFNTEAVCKHVDLAFVVGSWVMTGLLFGYIPYLLFMIRVPRSIPKVTPNPLLDTSPISRRSSTSSFGSVNSTTRLIREDSTYGRFTPLPEHRRAMSHRPSSFSTPPRRGPPPIYTRGTYGSMGMNHSETPPSRSVSVTPPTPTAASGPPPHSLQSAEALARSSQGPSTRALPTPPMFTNPFLDPLSRQNTPRTAVSQTSFYTLGTRTPTPTHSRAHSNTAQWPPLMPLPPVAASSRTSPTPPNSLVPVWSPYENRWVYSSVPDRPMSGHPNIVHAGSSLRNHTSTPHSIHSVAGSMHMHFPDTTAPPAPVHTRAASDPVYRPSTAGPETGAYIDPDAPLPNPFPLVSNNGAAEIRRFGSVPSAQFYTGQGGTYRSGSAQWGAVHLAGALGRTPPRAEAAVADRERWMQLVFSAATGRTAV